MLTLSALRTFTAVVEEASFTVAADRLNATQSGVSQQVLKLERTLGARLIDRSRKGALATPAGRQLYAQCITLLRDVTAIETSIAALGQGHAGHIDVGLMPAMTRSLIGPALRECLTSHPNASVNVVERMSSELIQAVAGNQLDVAIVPAFDAPDSMRCRTLGRSAEVLLARRGDDGQHLCALDVRTLAPLRLILQSEGNIRRRRTLAWLRSHEVKIEALMALDSMFGTLEYVQHSDFVTILPAMMLLPEIKTASMCVRPLAGEPLLLDLIAIEPARREPSPLVDALLGHLRTALIAFNQRFEAACKL